MPLSNLIDKNSFSNTTQTSGGFGSFGSAGGFGSFGTSANDDLTASELVAIAQASGGAVGQVAMELAHPERSMLSTVGLGFKNAFKGFVDLISIPSEIVAGAISPNFTIKEAIEQHKRVSDALFGDTNIFGGDTPTTMQKIGNFAVRLPFDILGDPLTYVTFGAGAGVFGLRSLPKIDLGLGTIEKLGLTGKAAKQGGQVSRAVTEEGQQVLGYLKNAQRQAMGKTGFETFEANLSLMKQRGKLLESGVIKEAELDFTEKQLKDFLKVTTESPLNIDWSKKAVSRLLEHNPALVDTMLDKGGMKFFGKTLLSAQRIGSVIDVIPGMTALDDLTLPLRQSIMSKFDPALKPMGKGAYQRLPDEIVQFKTQLRNMGEKMSVDSLKQFQDIQKTLNLSKAEWDIVYDAVQVSKMPADSARLSQAYLAMKGINEGNKDLIERTMGTFSNLENHIGNVLVPEDTRGFARNSAYSKELGSTKTAGYARYIMDDATKVRGMIDSTPAIKKMFEEIPETGELKALTPLAEKIRGSKSVQEAGFKIGQEMDEMVNKLVKSGMTTEQALASAEVKDLFNMRTSLSKAAQNAERTGTLDDFGLVAQQVDDDFIITDELGNTYKRVQAHAKELASMGYNQFDTNLMTIMAHQTLKNQKQLIGQYYMEGLVRMFSKSADEAPEGWVGIKSDALSSVADRIGMPLTTADGREFVFNPVVAKDFETMLESIGKDEITSKFWDSFDKIQRYWKASVTSIFLMFHGRNAISNAFQNYADLGWQVFNPKTNIMAANLIWNDRAASKLARRMLGTGEDAVKATAEHNTMMAKEIFTDKTGYTWTMGELRNVLKENDIAFNPNIVGMMDVGVNKDKMLTDVFGVGKTKAQKVKDAINPFNVETNLATKAGRNLGRTIEEQARLVNFISNLNNTGDVLHAAARTKLFLFDYQHLTKFEKNTMRRLIPFYTWTRKNLELQARILTSTPGRISNELTAIRGVGEILGGEPLTDEEKKLLPSWMANTIAFKRKGKNGNNEIISGFGTPIESPFQALQPNALLGSISPLFRYPAEALTGYQFFQGKATSTVIDAQNFDNAPEAIKDFIGWGKYTGTTKDGKKFTKSYSLRPGNMHLVNNLPFAGRIGNVLGQMSNASTSEQAKMLQLITGINVRSYNFEQLGQQQENLLRQQIEQKLSDAGILGKFQKFYKRKNTTQEK